MVDVADSGKNAPVKDSAGNPPDGNKASQPDGTPAPGAGLTSDKPKEETVSKTEYEAIKAKADLADERIANAQREMHTATEETARLKEILGGTREKPLSDEEMEELYITNPRKAAAIERSQSENRLRGEFATQLDVMQRVSADKSAASKKYPELLNEKSEFYKETEAYFNEHKNVLWSEAAQITAGERAGKLISQAVSQGRKEMAHELTSIFGIEATAGGDKPSAPSGQELTAEQKAVALGLGIGEAAYKKRLAELKGKGLA